MVEEPKIASSRTVIPAGESLIAEVPVYITKSNFYRVIHADGVYGGGTPAQGNIMMTFFSERIPHPEKIVRDAAGNEIIPKREVKYGLEQEYEASIVMRLDTAKIMLVWLANAIKNAEALLQQPPRSQQK
jgi:hypothetical protein